MLECVFGSAHPRVSVVLYFSNLYDFICTEIYPNKPIFLVFTAFDNVQGFATDVPVCF